MFPFRESEVGRGGKRRPRDPSSNPSAGDRTDRFADRQCYPRSHSSRPSRFLVGRIRGDGLPAFIMAYWIFASRVGCPPSLISLFTVVDPTPIRRSFRQTTWQARRTQSVSITSIKLCGMPTGLSTSNAAPVREMLRTVQSITAPSNTIFPALKTRCRDTIRLSFILGTKVSFQRPGTARFTGVGAGCLRSTSQKDARPKSSGAR